MIEFLGRNEVATPERMANRFAFGILPMTEYNTVFVASPSYVVGVNSLAFKGHPIRFTSTDHDKFTGAQVVKDETHRRELGHIRIICDTVEEMLALMNTRQPVHALVEKHAGYLDPAEIAQKIDAIYDEVKARFNTPKEAVEHKPAVEQRPAEDNRQSLRDAVMARVTMRLERSQIEAPELPSHLERVAQPAVSFGRRM